MKIIKMKIMNKSRLTDLYDTSFIYDYGNKNKVLVCCDEPIAYCTALKAYILPKHPTDFQIGVIIEFLKQNHFEVIHKIKDLKVKYLYRGKRPELNEIVKTFE